jgi:hypothetical protein
MSSNSNHLQPGVSNSAGSSSSHLNQLSQYDLPDVVDVEQENCMQELAQKLCARATQGVQTHLQDFYSVLVKIASHVHRHNNRTNHLPKQSVSVGKNTPLHEYFRPLLFNGELSVTEDFIHFVQQGKKQWLSFWKHHRSLYETAFKNHP